MAPVRSMGFVDPGWEHGVAQDERKKKVRCNYCGKIVSGGIYRLKQHLARVSGEVTYCDKAPEEVYLKMKENLEGSRSNKRQKQDDGQMYMNFHSNDDEDEEERVAYRTKGKQLMGDRNMAVNLTPLRSLGYVDPGWEHGVAQDERKKKVKCNYCEKIVSGGINRFKQHLARIPGEVAPCKHAPEEVYVKIKDNMKWHRTGRRHRRPEAKDLPAFYMKSDNEDEEDEQVEDALHHMSTESMVDDDKRLSKDIRKTFKGMSPGSGSEPVLRRSRLDSIYLKTHENQTPQTYKQIKVKTGSNKKSRKEVISAICKFFYHAGVPLQAANSQYFHKMLELVGQYGQGLVGPSSQLISGRFLQEEIATIKNYLAEYKASWAITGCSVMADSWRDTQGRTLINFLVSCPRGVYFVSSVDGSDVVEDASNLFKLLDEVVEEIGQENVVQVITENTPSYKAAGKMLEEKRSNLFWSPCATYCIDQMLEDFVKIRCVGECMEKGQKITKFIYNQIWLLNLMKSEFIQGQELLKPSGTRYASSFATLLSLLDHRVGLRRMFLSNKWISSRLSHSSEGKEVEKIVLNVTFWKKMQYVRKSVEPILQVLQKVDHGESLSMPYIYNDMYRAKLSIKAIHGDDTRKYGPFWNVIDNHSNSFYHPLYLAAYYLNPSYRYRPDFMEHSEGMRGLKDCIARLEPDSTRRKFSSLQVNVYDNAKSDFGTELAINTRTELDPAAWWQQHGISCLELQRIAVRILSQTCSSYGCEHDWSIYDQIYSKRNNRLAHKKLNDLTYVHYNLRLRECQLRRRLSDSISVDGVLQESLLDDWIVDTDTRSSEGDKDIFFGQEQSDAYENDSIDYEDGATRAAKESLELMTVADIGTLDISHANAGTATATDEDSDLNYFDDDLSE
ncbi:HAT dimerization domain-containing protein [Quillaja saponaria]|uniref:HAT dimerization domain-containing protein n=1 Tax=Quillaja saponaria TaxID=32244 RepID=A0AAD7QFN4_QUISA|nr:HAT dimerization domain-containing protein [Quillaja saponaria]